MVAVGFLALLFVTALAPSTILRAEDYRTWHTIGGGYFEAKLTAVGSTSLTFENREGKSIEFPLANLKLSDQKYARDWGISSMAASNETSSAAVDGQRSAFAEKVYSDLVYLKGKRLIRFKPEPGDKPKYFAFYRSAQWCPPCRAFTPKLVAFYDKQRSKGAAFELVFISSDRDEDAMAEYMADYDMEWPAFAFGKNKDLVSRNGTGIPNLLVTDAEGNKLLDSYDKSGEYIGPTAVMKQLERLLKE
ncbi:MAG: thioredoxin-like domain-containing protein [Opitutales bacterium]